jgi:hypothetical protein
MREQLTSDVRKEFLEAQLEAALQSVIADDALVGGGEYYAAAVAALLGAEGQILVQDQLGLVFDLGGHRAILVELGLLYLSFHDRLVFLLTLWD